MTITTTLKPFTIQNTSYTIMSFQDHQDKINSDNLLSFRTGAAHIHINREKSLIKIKWDALGEPKDFKPGYQFATDLVKRFHIRNWLNDARNMAYLDIETQNWISGCIIPQLAQYELQKLARVVRDEHLAILVSCNIFNKITNNPEPGSRLACEIFTDVDNALFWLNH